METTLSILTILIFELTTAAQPVITQADALSSHCGTTYYAKAINFNPGGEGECQIWDFQQLHVTPIGNAQALAAAATPFSADYPTAQRCLHYTSQFVDSYGYCKISESKSELLSGVFTELGPVDFSNPRTLVVFPYAFNTEFTDAYQHAGERETHEVWAKYDGYGTLKLPAPLGTYQNVIRQKIIDNGQEDYIWFNVNPFYPIMQTSLKDNAIALIENSTTLKTLDVTQTKD